MSTTAIELLTLTTQLLTAAPSVLLSVQAATDALSRAEAEGRELSAEDWAAIRTARVALQSELLKAAGHTS